MYVWHREDKWIRSKRAILWNADHQRKRTKEEKYRIRLQQLAKQKELDRLIIRDRNVDRDLKKCYIACVIRKDTESCKPLDCVTCRFNIKNVNNLCIEVKNR